MVAREAPINVTGRVHAVTATHYVTRDITKFQICIGILRPKKLGNFLELHRRHGTPDLQHMHEKILPFEREDSSVWLGKASGSSFGLSKAPGSSL